MEYYALHTKMDDINPIDTLPGVSYPSNGGGGIESWSVIMMRRRLLILCGLTIIASLLTAAAAFAEGEKPETENPVIQFLASVTGATPDEIIAQKESGYSLGNVARGYLFAELTGIDPSDAMGESQGKGWGVMFRDAGIEPGGGGRGLGWMIGHGHGKPEGAGGRPDHAGGGKPDRPDREGPGRPPWAGGDGDDTGD